MNKVNILPEILEMLQPQIKKRLLAVGFLLLVVMLEATVLDRMRIFNINPNILLVSVIITGLESSLNWTLLFSYIAGMLGDFFGVASFGLNTLIFPLLGFLTYELSRRLMIETQWRLLAVVSLAVVFHNLVTALFFMFSGNPFPLRVFLLSTFIGSVYSAAVSPLVLKLFRFINRDSMAKSH